MRSLPTDTVQTAALSGDLPDVDGDYFLMEDLLRGNRGFGILLDAKHRQEHRLLCLQVVQVAADSADPAGRNKGKIHRIQPVSPHRPLYLLLKAVG